jgi:hypothetical protein
MAEIIDSATGARADAPRGSLRAGWGTGVRAPWNEDEPPRMRRAADGAAVHRQTTAPIRRAIAARNLASVGARRARRPSKTRGREPATPDCASPLTAPPVQSPPPSAEQDNCGRRRQRRPPRRGAMAPAPEDAEATGAAAAASRAGVRGPLSTKWVGQLGTVVEEIRRGARESQRRAVDFYRRFFCRSHCKSQAGVSGCLGTRVTPGASHPSLPHPGLLLVRVAAE